MEYVKERILSKGFISNNSKRHLNIIQCTKYTCSWGHGYYGGVGLAMSKSTAPVGPKFNCKYLAACFRVGFLLGLFFDPEDGGDMFLRNVG
jgi:hypothetical protein